MDKEIKKCSIDGCDNKLYSKGLCRKHYDKMRNHGDPLHRTKMDKNDIVLYDTYAEILLYNTGNKAIVDLDDVDRIKDFKWYQNSR